MVSWHGSPRLFCALHRWCGDACPALCTSARMVWRGADSETRSVEGHGTKRGSVARPCGNRSKACFYGPGIGGVWLHVAASGARKFRAPREGARLLISVSCAREEAPERRHGHNPRGRIARALDEIG